MPTVPVINENPMNTPEVQGTPVAPMRNAAPEQLQQLGQTMEGAGLRQMHVGSQIALRIQEQMDDANVKAAEARFIQTATDILHGDNGYIHTQGADAVNSYDKAAEAITKAKKDLEDSLSNDVQKRMFNQVSTQHLVTFGARMSEHRATQRNIYAKTESLSRAENMRTMRQNSDLGSADSEKYLAAGVAEVRSAFKGAGPEAQAKAERDFRTQALGDDITRLMVDNKYEDAKALLAEQVKAGNVDPDAANKLKATIQSNVERVEAISLADKFFAPLKGKQLQATDLEELLKKVDSEVADPELREKVKGAVTHDFTQQHSIQRQAYADNLNDVVNYKYAHNGSLRGVDPNKWALLDAKDKYELSRPAAVQTDLNTWYGFVTKPDTLTLENVKRAYMRGQLSEGDFKGFTERAMMLQKERTNPGYIQEAGAVSTRIDYFANQYGLNVYAAKTPEDKVQHGQLVYAVQNEIDRVKAQNKGKITADQVDQIIKKELSQQIITFPRNKASLYRLWGNTTYQEQRRAFQIPAGAVGVGMGDDGKRHYVDANNNDLGVAE